jgi:hypothetical protein
MAEVEFSSWTGGKAGGDHRVAKKVIARLGGGVYLTSGSEEKGGYCRRRSHNFPTGFPTG